MTEKGKPQVYQFPRCTKSKNNPDEVQPKSQPELNYVKWLKEVEYKKREVGHYTAKRLSDGRPEEFFNDEPRERLRRKIPNLCEEGLSQPRPQGFSPKKWVGREKALASAGHVSLRTP